MNYSRMMCLFATVCFSASVYADNAMLEKKLTQLGATVIKISDSPIAGFKTVSSDQGIIYITDDGRFVLQGKLLELKNNKAVDVTNKLLMTELNGLNNEMIIYPAKNQKHIINVFMDITCHYCHLLHQKIQEYNDLGITVRYLAFPRNGLNSSVAGQMEAIWTAPDRNFALDEAEKGTLPKQLKQPDIVKKHYNLGIKFGVTGTPNIILDSGEVIAGYVEPKELIKILEE